MAQDCLPTTDDHEGQGDGQSGAWQLQSNRRTRSMGRRLTGVELEGTRTGRLLVMQFASLPTSRLVYLTITLIARQIVLSCQCIRNRRRNPRYLSLKLARCRR